MSFYFSDRKEMSVYNLLKDFSKHGRDTNGDQGTQVIAFLFPHSCSWASVG